MIILELIKFQSSFDHIDVDHDGQISAEELKDATGADEKLFKKVDFDQSGSISFVEFLLSIFKTRDAGEIREGFLILITPRNSRDKIIARVLQNFKPFFSAFKSYDLDNSGKISAKDLRQWCLSKGLSESNAGVILEEFDFDKDGSIDYEEFVNAVIHHKM